MNPLAQKHEAIIMSSFVEKVLSLFKRDCAPVGLFKLIQCSLNIKNSLVALILCFGKQGFPLLQGLIEPLSVAVDTGLTDGPLGIS